MNRPRILITTSTGQTGDLRRFDAVTGRNYSEGVLACGGLPLMVASLDPAAAPEFAAAADGVLFSGGVDVHPRHYGQEPVRDLGRVDAGRDAFELALYRAARERGLPILGICRGEQLINVAEGGTLHQHIHEGISTLDHSQDAGDGEPHHTVRLEEGSILARAFSAAAVTVNSYHHQAVDRPGASLRVTARSADGLAEAVEGTEGAWLLGVQWHPEMSFRQHEQQLAPFRAFLDAVNRARLQPA